MNVKSIIILFIFILPNFLFSQEVISLEDFLQNIQDKLPEIKQSDNTLKLAKNEYFRALSAHDVQLNSSFNGLYTRNDSNKSAFIKSDKEQNDIYTGYSAGLNSNLTLSTVLPSGSILSIGGTYSQKYTENMIDNHMADYSYKSHTTSYDPEINLGIKQPLLYNFFGLLDRSAKKDAKLKIEIETLKRQLKEQEILHSYKKLYFSWIKYGLILEYINTSIKNIDVQIKIARDKIAMGLAEDDMLYELLNNRSVYLEDYKNTQTELIKVQNKINLFVDISKYKPDPARYDGYLTKSLQDSYTFFEYDKTHSAHIINLSINKANYGQKVAENKLLPELNFFTNLDLKFHRSEVLSEGKNTITQYYGNPDVKMGLEFKYAFGNHDKRAGLKQIEIEKNDLLLEYEKLKNQHDIDLNSLINSARSSLEIITLKEERINTLKKIYTIKLDKFNKGLLDFSILTNIRNQIAQAEIELINIKTSLILLNLDYTKKLNS